MIRLLRDPVGLASLATLLAVALACYGSILWAPHPYDAVYADYVQVEPSLAAHPTPAERDAGVAALAVRAHTSVRLVGDAMRFSDSKPIDPRVTLTIERSDMFRRAGPAHVEDDGRAVVVPVAITPQVFVFGTDANGRDLLVRILVAGRISLAVGALASIVALGIGVTWGAVAGYAGGRVDGAMMRFVDLVYALPFIFLVIVLVALFGRTLWLIFIAIGAVEWLDMARIVRGQTLSLKRREFVLAAHALGASDASILRVHIVPNMAAPIVAYLALLVPRVILAESFLSFLGLGVQEPLTSWGTLIADGARHVQGSVHLLVFPALALAITVVAANQLGEAILRAGSSHQSDVSRVSELLRFESLGVCFGDVEAVRDLSLAVAAGETAAIVGESGSGKSVAMLAALGLLPRSAGVRGRVLFEGRDLLALDRPALDRIRGKAVSIIFQEPQSALDPLFPVGAQIAAVLRYGRGLTRREARARALALLEEVDIAEPARRARAYPHELSGGQRQRVAIAMAIACEPALVIADEPTTALDVTVAARILTLLAELKARRNMALILISHDLGLVRRVADSVHVMEKGRLVESGPTEVVTLRPREAYTLKLLAADELAPAAPGQPGAPLLEAHDVGVRYPLRGGWFWQKRYFVAVEGVSLAIAEGETLGLIGESGSGKSTLGRALLKLEPSTGRFVYAGRDLAPLSKAAMRPLRRELQIVFQDPFSSLSPRRTVGAIVGEGLAIHTPDLSPAVRAEKIARAMADVGLPADFAERLPHALSGGQRQRVAIARAIVLEPRLIVLDEPTSALDRSIQAEVLALLARLQAERGLAYLLITHDLAVVRAMAGRLAVMRGGRIIETGATEDVMASPREAYTRSLVDAAFGPRAP